MLLGVISACDQGAETDQTSQTTSTQGTTASSETTTGTSQEKTPSETAEGLGPNMLLLPTMENMSDKFPGSWDNYGLLGRMALFSRLLRLDSDLKPVYGDLASE
jgi:hypothetical protein